MRNQILEFELAEGKYGSKAKISLDPHLSKSHKKMSFLRRKPKLSCEVRIGINRGQV